VHQIEKQSYDVRRGVNVHVWKVLMLIAQHDMDLVLEFMLAEVSKAEPDRLFALGLIDILKWTFENGKGDLTLQLANCAEILMRCLNPNKPDLRKFVQV
jgi:hypothetical protein